MAVTVPITAHTTAINVTAETTSRVRRVRGLPCHRTFPKTFCSTLPSLPSLCRPPALRLLLLTMAGIRRRA